MQNKLTIFENIPYEARAIKGSILSASHAQEALEDVFADTSVFFEMPTAKDIVKVKSDNVYGVHKLIVSLKEGVAHPEYMLNARVADLEPKLVNVIFSIASPEDFEDSTVQAYESEPKKSQTPQNSEPKDISLITLTCSELELTYAEFAKLIAYETEDILATLREGVIAAPMRRSIELYLENVALKKELETAAKAKAALKEWLS